MRLRKLKNNCEFSGTGPTHTKASSKSTGSLTTHTTPPQIPNHKVKSPSGCGIFRGPPSRILRRSRDFLRVVTPQLTTLGFRRTTQPGPVGPAPLVQRNRPDSCDRVWSDLAVRPTSEARDLAMSNAGDGLLPHHRWVVSLGGTASAVSICTPQHHRGRRHNLIDGFRVHRAFAGSTLLSFNCC